MKIISIKIIFVSIFLLPVYLFAQDNFSPQRNLLTSAERKELINRTLAKFDQSKVEYQDVENIGRGSYQTALYPNIGRGFVMDKTLDKLEFELAIGIGYLNGYTSYKIDFPVDEYTGSSKLEFPFGNWLTGGNILLGRHPFYLNLQGWTNISKNTDGEMEDRDWIEQYLFSSTESDADAQIVILDVSLLYNFWQGDKPWGDVGDKFQKGWLGFLIGYKYENFQYDIIGVRDVLDGGNYYSGEKVLDYKIKYQIPYLGLNWQYYNDVGYKVLDRWGVNVLACVSPYVIAKDRDDHILRNKVIHGNSKGYGFLMGLNTFFNTKNHWIYRLGLDYTYINTDGKQKQYWYGDDPASPGYDDTGGSIEGINLEIESSQFFFWGLLQYKF